MWDYGLIDDLQGHLRARLDQHDLGHRADVLLGLSRRSIRLRSGPQPTWADQRATILGQQEVHVPEIMDGVVGATAIAAGGFHCLALLEDASVVAWGSNEDGQLGDGTRTDRMAVSVVSGLGGPAVALSAGMGHNLAVLVDGSVMAWGSNADGQLGDGSTARRRLKPVPVGRVPGRVVAVAAGGSHSVVLTDDGEVFAWGRMRQADTGGSGRELAEARLPVRLTGFSGRVVALAAGRLHSVAVTEQGAVFEWTVGNSEPQRVPGLDDIVGVSAGDHNNLAVRRDGSVWGWGLNQNGELGDGTTLKREEPVRAGGPDGVVTAATAGQQSLMLRADGSVWATGDRHPCPEPVTGFDGPVRDVAVAQRTNLALLDDGRVTWWGRTLLFDVKAPRASPALLPIGATKLGGDPDLPPGAVWPSVAEAPHAFVAQVNLAEVAPYAGGELPTGGLLSFFYDGDQWFDGSDPSHADGWAVLYSPPNAALVRTEAPDGLPGFSRFRQVRLTPHAEMVLPSVASLPAWSADLSEDDQRKLWALEMDEDDSDEPIHRLLGHEQPVQHGHVQALWCQRAANGLKAYGGDPDDPLRQQLDADGHAWRLLLQVDADRAAGTQWGDLGRIYYWIRAADLAAQRFDNTWLVCQSH